MKKYIFILFLTILTINVFSQSYYELPKFNGEKVRIVGLENQDSTTLSICGNLLKEYFGFKISYENEEVYLGDSYDSTYKTIDVRKFLWDRRNEIKTFYVTNKNISLYGEHLNGAASKSRSTLIIYINSIDLSNTLKHEVGHLLGLHHCENKKCLMFEYQNKENTSKLCDICLNHIH